MVKEGFEDASGGSIDVGLDRAVVERGGDAGCGMCEDGREREVLAKLCEDVVWSVFDMSRDDGRNFFGDRVETSAVVGAFAAVAGLPGSRADIALALLLVVLEGIAGVLRVLSLEF